MNAQLKINVLFSQPKHMLWAPLKRTVLMTSESAQFKNEFSYFSTKTYVVGTQKNHFDETSR